MATITSDEKMSIQQGQESEEMPINVPSESPPKPIDAPINSTSLFLTRLPEDVRLLIYDILISQKHEIEYCTWSPYVCSPSILGPLQASCKVLRQEVDSWYERKSNAGVPRHPIFGIFNPETTSFWSRLFRCNIKQIIDSGGFLNIDILHNHPIDSSVLPPFASSNDIRCVPNVIEGSPQTEEDMEWITSSHKRHWKNITGRVICQ